MRGTVVAGAVGNCVHVAGVVSFLRIAERLGYRTVFLGAAVPVDDFVEAVRQYDPDVVGVSYRLTPGVAENLLRELRQEIRRQRLDGRRFVFGGTPPVCEVARKLKWFDRCFTGLETPEEVWSYLKGDSAGQAAEAQSPGDSLVERIERKHPYPLLRHHFGLPTVESTVAGVERIADSGVLDVISIAPDQNAQESFFRPEHMDPMLDGAGGVPVRSVDDLVRIHRASRRGNKPLLRIYSGTRNLVEWAEVATKTLANAWGAIPLCWYNSLDGRSSRPVEPAIHENQECIRWYGQRSIPVEVNESHHWSLREAHDTIAVVMAYLAAYNAKALGVRHYVAQYMFNTPPSTTGAMDLAKMLAKMQMIESLHGTDFFSFRQVRAGLLHLSPNLNQAKGQLAASTMLALAVRPHIIHVVGFCEGDHAASADDVIESCQIVQGVIRNSLFGMPDLFNDPLVQERKEELVAESEVLLAAIRSLGDGDEDPLTSSRVLTRAIETGVLDAPHLKGNPFASGRLETRPIDGAIYAVDPHTKRPVKEAERLASLLSGGSLPDVIPLGGSVAPKSKGAHRASR